jgi:two-component system, NtrC family, response regulator AtoC
MERIGMITKETGIHNSEKMNNLMNLAARIAKFPTTVLIEGETGVGKEIMANWIHHNSNRNNMPLIKINCGAIPEGLIESELFGYEKGAFTGAKQEGSPGIFEQANKGTIFLDEIGELTSPMQVKILRVIQDHEVRRVGGSWSKIIDVRIIAATNQKLENLVEEGEFRKDLYYRLKVAHFVIPPLRDRREDIEPLIKYFISTYNKEYELKKWFNSEAIGALLKYDYHGNVRELRNIVEIACITSINDEVTPRDLPEYLFKNKVFQTGNSLSNTVEEAEKKAILNALRQENSIRKAAKLLEISNATMLRKMKKYGI